MTETTTAMICEGCGLDLCEQGISGTEVQHNELQYEYTDGEWVMTYSRNMGNLYPTTYECKNCGRSLTEEQENELDA